MITASEFIAEAGRQGFDFYTGVPCSFLTPLINGVLNDRVLKYVGATSEGEAVAIAAGAWLAGRQTVVMCQNSGLGNAVNPLTSLNAPFFIPSLLITTWRGQPGIPDEPQHQVMGTITQDLLKLIGVPQARFPTTTETLAPTLAAANVSLHERSLPFALVMEKGSVQTEELKPDTPLPRITGRHVERTASGASLPTRVAVLERFLAATDDETAVIATTGKCGRELFTLADRPQHLYQVGSMGGASAMGLGVALNTAKTVVVLDGDGAALMKMGNLATIGANRPANLIHILLDNGVHDSTGGQATVSASVDFAAVALACGYQYATSCQTLDDFDDALRDVANHARPAMIHVRIAPGSLATLGRPTVAPVDVARRFKAFLAR
ncbi:phosphonopyruvate decarboxylase [Telmatospirillum sp.]|uniref:phosphonopyruvate decarboxylase n=1 Tax=Telmatospirillum sp. TaxID=2079197 RepID=UPI0028506432|nr:phosphonopyruvate decarboxylase [Telmatospirillum sp.]MDR3440866.1 phosphonopyruvate decarboxylase [Telmatospirillum sp.]